MGDGGVPGRGERPNNPFADGGTSGGPPPRTTILAERQKRLRRMSRNLTRWTL